MDASTGYGRDVMRGVMRYANLQRSWLIYEEIRRMQVDGQDWPQCDGAIIAGVGVEGLEKIRRRSRFVVHCSGSGNPKLTPVVSLDDVAVGEMAAEHLIDCRLEHFAYYRRSLSPLSLNRELGFKTALATKGKQYTMFSRDWSNTSDPGKAYWLHLARWLRELPKPVGIFAVDDPAASDLAATCFKAGIGVPDQVAILGVNDDKLLCESAWPPLSSVEGDFQRIGYLAAQILDRLLKGEKLKASERLIRLAPLGIRRRLSTDILAVDDPNLAEAMQYIREHACDPCTVADLLREVPVGRRWLERQFMNKLGRTPHDEILRVQMETARRLLLQTGLGLSDIAARCGFSGLPSFGRAFTRAQGSTPAAFRRAALRAIS